MSVLGSEFFVGHLLIESSEEDMMHDLKALIAGGKCAPKSRVFWLVIDS